MSGVGLEVREGCLAKLGWEQRPGWPLLGTTCHLLGRLKPRLHLRGLCRFPQPPPVPGPQVGAEMA